MNRQAPKNRVSFYLPLLDTDETDLLKHIETRLALAHKLQLAGWASRPASRGLVFETPDVEVNIADRLGALGFEQGLIVEGLRGGPDAMPTVAEYYADPPRMGGGLPNLESPWLRFGELSLPNGKLKIGDPLNPPQQHHSVHLPNGNYLILVRARGTYDFVNVTRVRIAKGLLGSLGEVIAEIPVNVDQVGFYDGDLGDAVNPAVPVYLGDGERVLAVREVTRKGHCFRVGIEVALEDREIDVEDEDLDPEVSEDEDWLTF